MNYQEMNDARFYQECADATRVLALRIVSVTSGLASTMRDDYATRDRHANALLEFGMTAVLNTLADLVSNCEMLEDSEGWIDPILEELNRRFPSPAEQDV